MAILTSLTSNDPNFIVKFPSGTAAQRPSDVAGGILRYNTNQSKVETYDGTAWSDPNAVSFLQQKIELPRKEGDLVCHLDAWNPSSYSGIGTTWNDVSGNNRNFTWASTPTFGYDGNIPYFTTLNNLATGPASNSFGITSNYTILIVCKQLTLTNNHGFKFYRDGTGGGTRGIAPHLSWTDGTIYFDQGGCCDADTRTSVASGGTSNWNIWIFSRYQVSGRSGLEDRRSIYKNSQSLTTNPTAAAALNLNSTAATLGGSDEYGGNSSTWDARISEFIVYNRGITGSELNIILTRLRLKYNIGS